MESQTTSMPRKNDMGPKSLSEIFLLDYEMKIFIKLALILVTQISST